MREQSGRSLIEVVGVLAIAGVMSVGAIGIYNSVRHTQKRTIASAELEQIVKNVHILMESRGTYEGLSVDYLIKAGALNSDASPIGGEWSIGASLIEPTFVINLTELSEGDCDYFASATPSWASRLIVNGYEYGTDLDAHCFSSGTNQITFVVE